MKLGGVLFADSSTGERHFFTVHRSAAALPFGCRYRALDFPLSAMAHAGVEDVSLVAGYGFHSLFEHVGSGKAWDLARMSGGIRLVSPYRYGRGSSFSGQLEALCYMSETLENMTADCVFLADCDAVSNPDLAAMAAFHLQKGASLTVLAANSPEEVREGLYLHAEDDGRIRDARVGSRGNLSYLSLGIFLLSRKALLAAVRNAKTHGGKNLVRDALMPILRRGEGFLYPYQAPYARLSDPLAYYRSSMALLSDAALRSSLIADESRPILTSNRPTAPTRYGKGAEVVGSLVAEGCCIEGRVENSLLFRGAVVGRGSLVKNSVLFGGSYIGQNCELFAVCAEKHSAVRDGQRLIGHPHLPLFIEQGKVI